MLFKTGFLIPNRIEIHILDVRENRHGENTRNATNILGLVCKVLIFKAV